MIIRLLHVIVICFICLGLRNGAIERSIIRTAPPMYATQPRVHQIIEQNELRPFMRAVGQFESNNNHSVVSTRGFLGTYQFNKSTLRRVGIFTSTEEFLRSPSLQDIAMIRLMQSNRRLLGSIIARYSGTSVDGLYVTESGILAAAHLVGPGAVMAAFSSDTVSLHSFKDGNGVSAADYMQQFAGYRIRLRGIEL